MAMNVVTQGLCIRGVNKLTAVSSRLVDDVEERRADWLLRVCVSAVGRGFQQ